MARKSETLKQREKAQKDLLELKKMQQGLIDAPENKTEQISPKTFKEKKENFFYHYRPIIYGVIVVLAILAFIVFDTVTKTKYDSIPVLFAYEPYPSEYLEELEETLVAFYEDSDQNGEVNISVLDCSFSPSLSGYEYQKNQRGKLQTRIASGESLIFILDEKALTDLEAKLEYDLFKDENILDISPLLEEGFAELEKQFIKEEKTYPKEKLFLCLREIEGSLAEEKTQEYAEAKNLLNRVREKLD